MLQPVQVVNMEGQLMAYESPRFTVHGSIESLTMQTPDGNDPCRTVGPHGPLKQTGEADGVHSQGPDALANCSA